MSANPVWIVDPGHAWLEVDIRQYPDALQYGTGFGYASGHLAYLEEDCEAPAFLRGHPELDSRSLRVLHFDDDAPCRFLPPIPSVMVTA
jgi:hypothetical protein